MLQVVANIHSCFKLKTQHRPTSPFWYYSRISSMSIFYSVHKVMNTVVLTSLRHGALGPMGPWALSSSPTVLQVFGKEKQCFARTRGPPSSWDWDVGGLGTCHWWKSFLWNYCLRKALDFKCWDKDVGGSKSPHMNTQLGLFVFVCCLNETNTAQ